MGRGVAMVLVAASALGAGGAARADAWEVTATRDGVTYAHRTVEGSPYLEYRAETHVPLPPERVLEAIWTGITQALPATVKKREVLRRADDELLVYDRIHAPVVSDRDVTIRLRKRAMAGALEVRFESANAEGPPEDARYVRIPVVRGGWTLSRATDGGTLLRYQCYSEPGGSVPAWMVRSAQQDQIEMDVQRILGRLRK